MPTQISAGAVVYAKDLARVSEFYANVVGLEVVEAGDGYVLHQSKGFQLVVHAIPAHIADTIEIIRPPIRREDTAVKLVFLVPSINDARALAVTHGGELNGREREWHFQDCRVCDGHDPEGNVIQLRENAP